MFKKRIELIEKCLCCADKAGIVDKMFISFGTLLGSLRPTLRYPKEGEPYYDRGFMSHDKDQDLGFLPMHPQQKEAYFNYCCEAGMFSHWEYPAHRKKRRQDTGEFVWFSVKLHKKRCCQWFFFEYKQYMLHSKGAAWVKERKFPTKLYPYKRDTQAIALGAPLAPFKELIEIDFEGLPMNVPLHSGELLDYWYPSWHMPRKGGASKKNIVVIVNRWENPKSWRIL